MPFIRTETGRLVNLARVAFAEMVRDGLVDPRVDLCDRDGEHLGQIRYSRIEEFFDRPVFADTRGSVLVEFWDDGSDDSSGCTRHPVLGWQLNDHVIGARPIIAQGLPRIWCLEVTVGGDTRWHFPQFGSAVDTFAEAEALARSKFAPPRSTADPATVKALASLPAAIEAALKGRTSRGTRRRDRAPFHNSHKSHAHCGRVCMPAALFDEFVGRRNHDAAEAELRNWAMEVERDWEHFDGEPGNPFEFWRARYRERWPTSPKARTSSAAAEEPNRRDH